MKTHERARETGTRCNTSNFWSMLLSSVCCQKSKLTQRKAHLLYSLLAGKWSRSTVVVDLDHFSSFLIYTQSVGLLGRGISLSQGRHLQTEQHKRRINTHRHLCLKWDSKSQSKCSNGRRRFIP
jgi:hypothetical protein